jgi:hypothetical protein
MLHLDFAERARLLADTLSGVRFAAARCHYAPALALVRTALEHHLVDKLMFHSPFERADARFRH